MSTRAFPLTVIDPRPKHLTVTVPVPGERVRVYPAEELDGQTRFDHDPIEGIVCFVGLVARSEQAQRKRRADTLHLRLWDFDIHYNVDIPLKEACLRGVLRVEPIQA